MILTAEHIKNFTEKLLISHYDNPKPIPQLHLDMWKHTCSDHPFVALAAPRKHAKSTAITHAYTLASLLFRDRQYAIVTSNTIDMACEFLHDLKTELLENEELQQLFKLDDIYKDTVGDVRVRMQDGHKFRIVAKGALQAMRGIKWEHKRPDLLIGDDLENDEMVMNDDRRIKFRDWFFKTWVPIRADDGIIRVVGTILHEDSLLNGLIRSDSWSSDLYKAHASYNDFTKILWPEQWSEEKLHQERQLFIDAGAPEGYSQEYLNDPTDSDQNYFQRTDFHDLNFVPEWRSIPRTNYILIDPAVSKQDRRAYTVLMVVGITADGYVDVLEVRRFRGDTYELIESLFELVIKYEMGLDEVLFESGHIFLAVEPTLIKEMEDKNVFFAYDDVKVSQDKTVRARPIQQRFRVGRVRADKQAPWYGKFEDEFIRFPRGMYKDQVDALSLLGMKLPNLMTAPTEEDLYDSRWNQEMDDTIRFVDESLDHMQGADPRTGY